MSLNRKNIVWQSKDGTWNMAMYDFYHVNEDSDDFDHEWDVEYTDDFNWVTMGHSTEEATFDAWRGANPGSHEVLPYSEQNAAEAEALDEKARQFKIDRFSRGRR